MNNMSLSANKKYRIENNAPHYIGFFGKSSAFSNFHPVPLVYETKQLNSNCEAHKNITYYFKSSEHLYKWKKGMSNPSVNKCYSIADDEQSPPDGAICSSIRTAPTPSHAKYIARHKVKINFHTWSLPSRISIMREIVNLKFKNVSANAMPLNWNPDKVYTLKGKSYLSPSEQLLLTGNTILVETSPYDKIWGSGMINTKFEEYVNKMSMDSGVSVHKILSTAYPIPIASIHNDQPNPIGFNLLGRILMEQREKLRNFIITPRPNQLVIKPISDCNNNILKRRLKNNDDSSNAKKQKL